MRICGISCHCDKQWFTFLHQVSTLWETICWPFSSVTYLRILQRMMGFVLYFEGIDSRKITQVTTSWLSFSRENWEVILWRKKALPSFQILWFLGISKSSPRKYSGYQRCCHCCCCCCRWWWWRRLWWQ